MSWWRVPWNWCGKSTGGGCERWRLHKGSECMKAQQPKGAGTNAAATPPTKKVHFTKDFEARIKALEARVHAGEGEQLGPHDAENFDFR